MPNRKATSGAELFIVDNSDTDWKVARYLHDWCQISSGIDISTGYFEIGSLLTLQDEWQKVDRIRILMGDEVSKRTKDAFAKGVQEVTARLDDSLEKEKLKNDFLAGVPAIVEGIRSGKILCRVYRKDKFHAKAYITKARLEVVGASALVGSSNFTYPGLTENIELNVQITGRPVAVLQEWYEEHWNQAEDVTPEVLRVCERHVAEYMPFDVYAKALDEFFRSHVATASEWESSESKMYPVLDQYQRDGYHSLLDIANTHGGAFLCDGVGLGKTFVGLMLIERLVVKERKRVLLLVPKTAREDVWERSIRDYLSRIGGLHGGDFSNLVILNHTDLGRGGEYPYRLERIKEFADVVVIDEAHHFRNPGTKGTGEYLPSRYRILQDLLSGPSGVKQLFMLTATPVNNTLHDFRHMAELFTQGQDNYFGALLGVHSLRSHFVAMERELKKAVEGDSIPPENGGFETNFVEAEQVLKGDSLFQALVVQRSRAFVRKSQIQQGGSAAMFPEREAPRVAEYSVKKTYGRLLDMVDKAFKKEKALFVLGIYYPLAYYKGPDRDVDPLAENRQKEVVSLIRTQFLKRFESSARAFELSCNRLLLKLIAWATKQSADDDTRDLTEDDKRKMEMERGRLQRWKEQHEELIAFVHARQHEQWNTPENEAEDDMISEEMLEAVEVLPRRDYNVEEILADTFLDMDQIADFLDELRKFKPSNDDKLKALVTLLKKDPVLRDYKVLIFSEYAETARYVRDQLREAGISGVSEIDSGTKVHRSTILQRFAPYYNGSSSADLAANGEEEIRVLISTDVLSEGINLQDATRIINYDLHWNPVRLMQRIGRVDRRMNPQVEARLLADHPDQKDLRGKIVFWNFLPPDDLEELLRLYSRVSHKTLLISKTLGIEGRKLLHPEDEYEALRDFNEKYDGDTTPVEELKLEYDRLLLENPGLAERIQGFPGRLFSGRHHPAEGTRAVFLCYRVPKPDPRTLDAQGTPTWTEDAGETLWLLHTLPDGRILDEPTAIANVIRSTPDTPRHCEIEPKTLSEIRAAVEKKIRDSILKSLQAPQGVKPILKCWMELS